MSRMPRNSLLIAAALFLTLGFLLIIAGCGEEAKKAELDPTTIGEYNKPGIVIVETTWTADVTVPDIDFDEQALFDYVLGQVDSGALSADMTDEELLNVLIAELATNPQYYVYALPADRETSMDSSVYGSGFIVTEDGSVLTNAHVVKKSEDELRTQMAIEAGSSFLLDDLQAFEDYLGVDLPTEYEDLFLETTASLYEQYMTVTSPEQESQMYLVNVDGKLSDPVSVETVEVGDPIDMMEETGKDVAVLKVNEKNLPTVALGDDADLKDGEQAIALGYPAVATFDPGFDLTNLAPTLTQGTISSQKTMEGGWKVIQTDATISGGSSGSPLFNSKGEAVGINTFGATELNEETGQVETQPGYNYAIPMSVAKEFLDKANVDPQIGPLTMKYHEAIDLYDSEKYSDARQLFQEIDEANTDYPYVDEYIENATAKINDGLDKSGSAIPAWLLIVLIAGGGVLVLGGGGFLFMKSRGKKAAAGTGAAGAAAEVTPQPAPKPAAPAAPTEAAPAATEPAPEPAAPAAPAAETGEAAGEDEINFCSKCGHELQPDDEFCSKCGHEVSG